MTRKERTRIAGNLRTAQALIKFAADRLDSEHRADRSMIRDIQADIEDAERIAAIAAQECGYA